MPWLAVAVGKISLTRIIVPMMGERESMKKTVRDDPEQSGGRGLSCKWVLVRPCTGSCRRFERVVRQHVTGRKQALSNSAIIQVGATRCFGSSRILFHSGAVDYPQYRLPLILWFLED
jgi:hypothetical protein